jgi:hypothetical protein
MRLIDADAHKVAMRNMLRDEWHEVFDDPDVEDSELATDVFDVLDKAPTVCCEACARWQAHEPPNTSGWGTCRDTHAIIEGKGRLFTPPDFGCAYFERRQP